ncbi:hypothetical protein MRB53_018198 [Persea americana]|uniref:Uncharacterized protein n=1 Tax=Persea americana TaxID=3435 RepID=A0ACC2M858_PERAE|nr:hypothetical protein MRB53_018198 [Persea americana]
MVLRSILTPSHAVSLETRLYWVPPSRTDRRTMRTAQVIKMVRTRTWMLRQASALPWVGGSIPGGDDGGLEEEDEHDPEVVEAAEDVPERVLLNEACLYDDEEIGAELHGPLEAAEAMVSPEIPHHVVEDVAEAFRGEAEIRSFGPDEEEDGGVDELSAGVGATTSDQDVGFLAKVLVAGGVVVGEELKAEAADDEGVEGVDCGGGVAGTSGC